MNQIKKNFLPNTVAVITDLLKYELLIRLKERNMKFWYIKCLINKKIIKYFKIH